MNIHSAKKINDGGHATVALMDMFPRIAISWAKSITKSVPFATESTLLFPKAETTALSGISIVHYFVVICSDKWQQKNSISFCKYDFRIPVLGWSSLLLTAFFPILPINSGDLVRPSKHPAWTFLSCHCLHAFSLSDMNRSAWKRLSRFHDSKKRVSGHTRVCTWW